MNTDSHGLFLEEESEAVLGSAFEVMNSLGHGFHEKPYENALVAEFRLRNIPVAQQKRFPIHYKETKVGEYIPVLIVFEKIIIDTKVISRITKHEVGQMINYLRISQLKLGLIINFQNAKLEYKRIVL